MCVQNKQIHYWVLQITYVRLTQQAKITGGISPAVKSGENKFDRSIII